MDEKDFRNFMIDSKKSTRDLYVKSVKDFEGWLSQQGKRLEDAKPSDIRQWVDSLSKGKASPYLSGLRKFYISKPSNEMMETIKIIRTKIRSSQPKHHLFLWEDFRERIEKAEKNGASSEKLVLLNLLWSEMKPKEILRLQKLDIDFAERLITSRASRKQYRVTKEAWDALERCIPVEDRDKGEKLFPHVRANRTIEKIAHDYLKQTPLSLRKSCEEDWASLGKKERFDYARTEEKAGSKTKRKPKKRMRVKGKLFNRLVQEIQNFGKRAHSRIAKLNEEQELQRLLEGYFLATFPDEAIIPEFQFIGYENRQSRIDFVVGRKQKIPVEVKLAKGKIRDSLKGFEQVNEFLKSSSDSYRKGVLVIGDPKHDIKRQEHNGLRDNVRIIVI